jgi:hypothetical protein
VICFTFVHIHFRLKFNILSSNPSSLLQVSAAHGHHVLSTLLKLLTIFYCLRFETPPTCKARSQYLYSPRTGWPSYTPRHWVPFSSSPTTRRVAVEIFEPASAWQNYWPSLYSPGTDPTESVFSISTCSLVAGETSCPQSCFLATAAVLSTAYTAVTWQWICMLQYVLLHLCSRLFYSLPFSCCVRMQINKELNWSIVPIKISL